MLTYSRSSQSNVRMYAAIAGVYVSHEEKGNLGTEKPHDLEGFIRVNPTQLMSLTRQAYFRAFGSPSAMSSRDQFVQAETVSRGE
eukprot:3296563-Pleurochrysis_carterae.AAC.1